MSETTGLLNRLRRCPNCGAFTMRIFHCNGFLSTNAHCPVFKPFDRYARYRQAEKRETA